MYVKKEKDLYVEGWAGEPFNSDYVSALGNISHEDILNLRHCTSQKQCDILADALDAEYYIAGPFRNRPGHLRDSGILYWRRWKNRTYTVRAAMRHRKRQSAVIVQRYRDDMGSRARIHLNLIKTRAEKSGLAFDLDHEFVLTRLKAGVCEATGRPFTFDVSRGAFGPSLDRITCGGGYTKDNVQMVCRIYNMMRGNFDDNSIISFIRHIRSNRMPTDQAI